jgi:hypothetical protein
MNEAVQEFSFLNRWFIFKRKAEKVADAVPQEALPNVLTAPGTTVKKSKIRVVNSLTSAVETPAVPSAASAAAAPITAATLLKKPTPAAVAKEAEAEAVAVAEEEVASVLPSRTLPVASSASTQMFAAGEIFQFYSRAALQDKLKINDKGAARWLAPSAPFPIKDGNVSYPSLEHYMGGMMYKQATSKPELAVSLFARDGSIHQEYLGQRLTETAGGTKPLPEDRDYALLENESKDVKAAMKAATVKKYKGTFDETKWASMKDAVLLDGLTQRWENDAKLRKIVEAARNQGKILLFYTPGAVTNMGGVRRDDGTIEGDNKVGKILMSLAKFPGY